jgi:hypothetical protein
MDRAQDLSLPILARLQSVAAAGSAAVTPPAGAIAAAPKTFEMPTLEPGFQRLLTPVYEPYA